MRDATATVLAVLFDIISYLLEYRFGGSPRESGYFGHRIRDTQAGFNCILAVVDDDAAIYVSQVLSARTIAMFMRLGTRVPMYCTGVGKAILAHLAPDQAERAAAPGGYIPYTATTIRDWHELNRELTAIRALGYAVDREEREEGVICVAAPVLDHSNQPCAAVSVSGPSTRMLPQIEQLGGAVRVAAEQISGKLGYMQGRPR